MHSLFPRRYRGPGLIYLIDGDELFRQQGLDAVKIVGLIGQLGRGAIEDRPRIRDICLRFVDRRCRAIDVRGST